MTFLEPIRYIKRLTLSDDNLQTYDAIRNADSSAKSIKVRLQETGLDFTFENVPSGEIIRVMVDKVYSTGTTSTKVDGINFG